MKLFHLLTSFLLMIGQIAFAQLQPTTNANVFFAGAMRNVMWKGQLQGTIALDTIEDRTHLYGIGPIEQLSGEIMMLDGTVYTATVLPDHTSQVSVNDQVKAPFFVCARVHQWRQVALPDSVDNLARLEQYLQQTTSTQTRPFAFRLTGEMDSAAIHVVNLPAGKKVSSPDDAHEGTVLYRLQHAAVELLGFFSTMHKGVFTHHDTNLHVHLITSNHQQMGHLEKLYFSNKGLKLYLPF